MRLPSDRIEAELLRPQDFQSLHEHQSNRTCIASQGTEVPDLDLNVLPPVLPKRTGNSHPASVTKKVWRKIVYWAKIRDKMSNRLSYLHSDDCEKMKVVVMGGGAFGTAMAAHVARKGHMVTMIVRNKSVCKFINRKHINPRYLSEFDLPKNVGATTDAAEALEGCDVLIHAVPVQSSREAAPGFESPFLCTLSLLLPYDNPNDYTKHFTPRKHSSFVYSLSSWSECVRQVALGAIRELVPPDIPVVAVSKALYSGVELGTRKLMCDVIPEAKFMVQGLREVEAVWIKDLCLRRLAATKLRDRLDVVVVSGPSFAQEIMDRRPTSVVAASRSPEAAEKVSRLLTSKYFRVSMTEDVLGVEVAGALKNVLAIAAGICEGLGLGTNAMSALVTQGNAEIRWLATAMGARPETLAGLSGMGDILLTCFGSLSRNRTVGVRLGKGERFEVRTASCETRLSSFGV
ncbi:GLY1 [Symbiodinium necroappetens]|uniref:Glycerol-3-phosphate dehydrogenase [NAD(+)] n=1 Tax=Symbiodinium necroappetens TaxID=1628268 RepID=A0A812QL34_9DINO|nr:GLY1 [Symbiodinium necroappetens]